MEKKLRDKGKTFAALLTDLSKGFECLLHDLIIEKLNAYGFSLDSSRLIHSCLLNRKQKTRIHKSYRSLEEILFHMHRVQFSNLFENEYRHCIENTLSGKKNRA